MVSKGPPHPFSISRKKRIAEVDQTLIRVREMRVTQRTGLCTKGLTEVLNYGGHCYRSLRLRSEGDPGTGECLQACATWYLLHWSLGLCSDQATDGLTTFPGGLSHVGSMCHDRALAFFLLELKPVFCSFYLGVLSALSRRPTLSNTLLVFKDTHVSS